MKMYGKGTMCAAANAVATVRTGDRALGLSVLFFGSSTEFVGEKWASWRFAPDPWILKALQDK
jgi:hypothetical protein